MAANEINETALQSTNLSEEEQERVRDIIRDIVIDVDRDMTAILSIADFTFKVRPLTRGLAKRYQRGLQGLANAEERDVDDAINYDDIQEECLTHSIVSVRQKGVEVPDFDLDDMIEPQFDMLTIHFQRYYMAYKKKSSQTT